MKSILTLFLLFSLPTFAQQIYQPFEVEIPAGPSGGISAWVQFINANIEIPFQHQVAGIDKKVMVKGVIEPDGTMSNMTILRGVDAACNAEVLRMLKLYKAWKPAKVGNTNVRQEHVAAVLIKLTPLIDFDTSLYAFVHYFDEKFVATNNIKTAAYRRVVPVDSSGAMRADVVYETKEGRKWKTRFKVPLQKKQTYYKPSLAGMLPDSIPAVNLFAKDENDASYGFDITTQQDGTPLAYALYDMANKKELEKKYDASGLVRSVSVFGDSSYTELGFYGNGQIMYQRVVPYPQLTDTELFTKFIACWDAEGNQLLKEGNGYWKVLTRLNGIENFTEEGGVVNGKKNGIWIARAADSTIYYREVYEADLFREGYVMRDGKKTAYADALKSPYYEGGLKKFQQLVGSSLTYPVNAMRRGVSRGKVKVSFTVCEDGSLCDYKVDEGAGFGFEEEVVRVVKRTSGKWIPGSVRGQVIRQQYSVGVIFIHQ